jgi:hypothetical protein
MSRSGRRSLMPAFSTRPSMPMPRCASPSNRVRMSSGRAMSAVSAKGDAAMRGDVGHGARRRLGRAVGAEHAGAAGRQAQADRTAVAHGFLGVGHGLPAADHQHRAAREAGAGRLRVVKIWKRFHMVPEDKKCIRQPQAMERFHKGKQ